MLRSIRGWLQDGASKPSTAFQFAYTTLWDLFVREHQAELDALVLEETKLELSLFAKVKQWTATAFDSETGWDQAVAELRKREEYTVLAERARRKRVLSKRKLELSPEYLHMTTDGLLAWLFEVRLGGWPENLHEFLEERGWTSEEKILEVAMLEYIIAHRTFLPHSCGTMLKS
jgi:hypothetical protein